MPIVSARFVVACAAFMATLFSATIARTVENEDCFLCHGDASAGEELYVDQEVFGKSVHSALDCTNCHYDIDELPHAEELAPVMCDVCHDEAEEFSHSLHGQALEAGDPLAPNCWDCHGAHDIFPATDPEARTNPVNIPEMCGACHAEDAPVAKSRNIKQHDILQHYAESIHGEGLLQKGLTVTAVCTSCHTAHNVLPHTDPKSTIHPDNVVGTCMKCHGMIEQVHAKRIEGKLWEEDPDKIPICIDCHQPHEVRKVYYDAGISDRDCMSCHDKALKAKDGQLPAVDTDEIMGSTHSTVRCAQCHTGATPSHAERPCATVAVPVDCAVCHADQVDQHRQSIHGQLLAAGDTDAPACLDCHAGHGTKSKSDPVSPTFPKNVPALCARCHREGEVAAERRGPEELHNIVRNYTMSIHGKGLEESGLLVTAMCTNCHTAHMPLPADDPRSTVNRANIPDTCGQCHQGIEETFLTSIHAPKGGASDSSLPVCSTCHTAHSISRTDEAGFKLDVETHCGQCHEDVMETYYDTYHGKVSKLGSDRAAKCHDCHGAHDVLPVSDPDSHLSRDNIVETCAQCHEGSHRRFAGYLTHATHHDPDKYPALFYTFWAMTLLLVGTFAFFGLHTLAWLPLSFKEMRRHRQQVKADRAANSLMFQRFDPIVRQLHFGLILSFFGLALTGMALKFSYMPWAQWLSRALGGFYTMGIIHRVCAVAMVAIFVVHLIVIIQRKRKKGASWTQLLRGPSTLIPNMTDFREFVQTMKWFAGRGPRPSYGQWTYWEKFDYFAVFWGVAVIGTTGFMLWFPEFCTRVLPGWLINVATIIHSDEALLATGFIFTIHFFNTHFRPEKFPMDFAMFTGRVSVEELKREKPRYYEQLVAEGELEKRLIPQAPKEFRFWSAFFGTLALIIGFGLVIFILWSMVFGYR